MIKKTYIGDSVYAQFNNNGMITLTTENGYGPSNTIHLEIEVLFALLRYAEQAYDLQFIISNKNNVNDGDADGSK